MSDPIDMALGRIGASDAFRADQQRLENWYRANARDKVLEAIASFLRRMNASGNGGTEKRKTGRFRSENVWRVTWVVSDRMWALWLTPDGRILETDGDLVPFREAKILGLTGPDVREIRRIGEPRVDRPVGKPFKATRFDKEADAAVMSLAQIVRANGGG